MPEGREIVKQLSAKVSELHVPSKSQLPVSWHGSQKVDTVVTTLVKHQNLYCYPSPHGRTAVRLWQTHELFVSLATCPQADVLLENFRPGVMEGWGLGPSDLKPDLIYTRISGYGQVGQLPPLVVEPNCPAGSIMCMPSANAASAGTSRWAKSQP